MKGGYIGINDVKFVIPLPPCIARCPLKPTSENAYASQDPLQPPTHLLKRGF